MKYLKAGQFGRTPWNTYLVVFKKPTSDAHFYHKAWWLWTLWLKRIKIRITFWIMFLFREKPFFVMRLNLYRKMLISAYYCYIAINLFNLKGTVPWDFCVFFFFTRQLLLVPLELSYSHFEIFCFFTELLAF